MPHEVGALARREERQGGADPRDDVVEGPRADGAEECFELRKGELDGVEVRTVRRQEPDDGPDPFDGRLHGRLFVDDQVVEHDDVAR